MPHRNVVTWTALINGLAIHGDGREALEAFYVMVESGLKPDCVAFMGALVACSHGGFVEEGQQVFQDMWSKYGVEPTLEHYGCMVDLLGRAGKMLEAFEFVERMHVKPNSIIWRTLLGACVKLAVAFVLLYHRDRKTIRIIKNLRICYDCHSFMKHVSGFFDRCIAMEVGFTILARDHVLAEIFGKSSVFKCQKLYASIHLSESVRINGLKLCLQ